VPGDAAHVQFGFGLSERYLVVAVGQLPPHIVGRRRGDACFSGDLGQGSTGILGDQITGQAASFCHVGRTHPAIQADPDRATH
jgi:hypothetical protein